jgi:asparagine synthase (glutamine-hydrolysing)
MYVGPGDALNVIPSLSSLYDEPMADSSQIPMYLVASLARQHVTVSLSGDGGDELFGGYTRYERALQMWNATRYVPRFAATASSWLMKSRWFSRWRRSHFLQRRAFRLVQSVANTESPCAMYQPFVTAWPDAFQVVTGAGERSEESHNQLPGCTDFLRQLMARDLVTYLPDDILAKVDRATMGVSLESRSPFLDHTIVDLSFRLPTRMLIHQGKAKWCLRQLLYRHVPPAMIERPKMGFGVPLSTWLRGPLRDWAEDLLDESRLKQEGFLDTTSIRHVWNSHQSRKGQWAPQLWNVLTFQAWLSASRQVPSTRVSTQFGSRQVA